MSETLLIFRLKRRYTKAEQCSCLSSICHEETTYIRIGCRDFILSFNRRYRKMNVTPNSGALVLFLSHQKEMG